MRFSLALAFLPLFTACSTTPTTVSTTETGAELDSEIVALKHASATEMALTIKELMAPSNCCSLGSTEHASPEIQVTADPRTNSILIQAPEMEKQQILTLVAALDVAVEG